MKKILTIALCFAAVATAGAQKANVDQASKLSGKADKLQEARNLIKQAMENPETKNDPKTYFVAGDIEFSAYDNAVKTQMINPSDPSAAPAVMADELMNGYKYFLQALPLDSLPNEKGQVKPKYSSKIAGKITGHANDFFNAGANYFQEKMYFPQAYEAFMVYGDLPSTGIMGNAAAIIPQEQIGTSYFNAGLAAYSGNDVDKSAAAFTKAREAGYQQKEAYIYEIACWQAVAQRDEARAAEAQKNIMRVAKEGNEKFGIDEPIFINNMINALVVDKKIDEALGTLNPLIDANPENANLLGLRGFIYDQADNDAASEADYRKAANLPTVDYETLKNASKKIFRVGTQKWDAIEGVSPEAAQARKDVKTNYFDVAKSIADKAQAKANELKANNQPVEESDLKSLQESIDYVLETYFNN